MWSDPWVPSLESFRINRDLPSPPRFMVSLIETLDNGISIP